jgi:ferredoxin
MAISEPGRAMDADASARVRYAPGNVALVIGTAAVVRDAIEPLRVAGLRAGALLTDLADPGRLPRGIKAVPGRLAELSGWMGAFDARMSTLSGPASLAPLSAHSDGHFDWVLDFSPTRAIETTLPPPGYYQLPPGDFAALRKALLEIAARIRSGFEKPRYFDLDAERCAHRRQGVAGCSACLAACATGAITAAKDAVTIEPHRCLGCGTCALVCPSGAVRYAHPRPTRDLEHLSALLAAAGRDDTAGVLIAAEGASAPAGWLQYTVDEPARLGLEFWLAALAQGARRVAILAQDVPAQTRAALAAQVALGQALLDGLGYPPALALVAATDALPGVPALPPRAAAALAASDDKRSVLFAALDALAASAAAAPPTIPLDAGPFGEVRIDAAACTLCTACVRICPADALELPGTPSALAFTEVRCVQCGLCANVCPEKAITLVARFVTARSAREAPRVVVEAQMAACPDCGKPFASQAMIARTRNLMAGHPMFQGDNARLMELCPECRQRAMAGVSQ